MDSNKTLYMMSYLRRVEVKIDYSPVLSFIKTSEYTAHEVVSTEDLTYKFRNLHF